MASDSIKHKSLSMFERTVRRFLKQRLALLSIIFILFLGFIAIFRDQLMPYGIVDADFFNTFCKASFLDNSESYTCTNPDTHFLGTDDLGRDTLSRLIYGTRITVIASILGVSIAAVLGLPIGLFSGYIGGRFDRAVMWVVDVIFSLPSLLVAFGIIAVLGDGLFRAMIAVGIVLSTRYARLARGVILAEKEELYVDSARVGGLKQRTIIFKHILPNIAPPLIVQTSLLLGAVILIEAQLSFVGIGVSVTTPSWGRMLSDAREALALHPYNALPAGLAIGLTVLAWNLLGDGIRDALGRDISRNQLTSVRKAKNKNNSATTQTYIDPALAKSAALMINNLEIRFPTPRGDEVSILRDVSYTVEKGKTLGIVGESGSGKSMSVLAAMGIIPAPGQLTNGSIIFNGRNISALSEREMQRIRGSEIAMIFQEPIASLNPALTVGQQLIHPIRKHLGLSKEAAWQRATELLKLVRIPDAERRMNDYPHQFSGGMAQRVGIARALSCDPKVLIADEPTTALDVTIQGQVIDLLKDIQEKTGISIIFITHDLGVIAEIADQVAVMYAGEVVETGEVNEVLMNPKHPYTRALLETLPHHGRTDTGVLPIITGMVPSPDNWPFGCRFHPRCQFASAICSERGVIPMQKIDIPSLKTHYSRCIRIDEIDFAREE